MARPGPQADRDPEQSRVKITGELSIRNVAELHQRLGESLGRGPDLVLDFTQVESCDTAGLQLICSLRKTAVQRGLRFRVATMSPAIEATAAALGFALQKSTVAERAGGDYLGPVTGGKPRGI